MNDMIWPELLLLSTHV